MTDKEMAHYALLACQKLLSEFNTDDCADEEDRSIPSDINNAFIRGGLLYAIELAANALLHEEVTPCPETQS